METFEIIGLIAATLTTSSFIPQVYKAWKYKSTRDVSLLMYLVLFIGSVLWLYYGLMIESAPVILANGITSTLVAFVVVLKLKYK
ncbi:SemiSWEET family sugar transporter [Flagellimonas sp. CMM7]|uniref:SemiSWEET family sugar transporter n=1 Tax=Flagellimonas sp. CMM7 TaxID=2654676 RepID=UPI0013D46932|nr:SemiSWEET transporter [Flagellimonas sp. CMM7]UII78139.1 SemiSWEET transporter [Flagellimonas sp. CMM7]